MVKLASILWSWLSILGYNCVFVLAALDALISPEDPVFSLGKSTWTLLFGTQAVVQFLVCVDLRPPKPTPRNIDRYVSEKDEDWRKAMDGRRTDLARRDERYFASTWKYHYETLTKSLLTLNLVCFALEVVSFGSGEGRFDYGNGPTVYCCFFGFVHACFALTWLGFWNYA